MLVDLEWILSPTREIYPPPGVLVSELPGLTEVVKRGQDRRQHPEAMYVAFPGEGDGLGRETFFVLFVDMDAKEPMSVDAVTPKMHPDDWRMDQNP